MLPLEPTPDTIAKRSKSDPGRPPVVRELPADLETPVSVYLKLAGTSPSFLLESVTGGERLARFSFIGVDPSRAYILRAGKWEIHSPASGAGVSIQEAGSDPFALLRAELAGRAFTPIPGLPRFDGGLVGYLGYEMVRYFEPAVQVEPDSEMPDALFLLADTLVAFDHAYGRLVLIANPDPALPEAEGRLQAESRLDEIARRLADPLPRRALAVCPECQPASMEANIHREDYKHAVEIAKEHIAAGDIFQVVLSQRLSRKTTAEAFGIYRALRRLNPSPYMFFFDFDGLSGGEPLRLIGASPELHVRLEGREAALRPIAGTRPRGKTPLEDSTLEKDLLADPKECAEHVMLVDLARNDLGRVCEYGSVKVSELMVVERYSHVMHIVSHVEGKLRPEYDAFDLMAATFPAGTVSGAPKIRAMQIIHDLETSPRGSYAGAVGYFAFDGSMDTCITIRTLRMRGDEISVQAGAGIVADSDPEREYQETLNKARALSVAVDMAEKDNR
jgi:anthranilate synthase component 1